MKAILPTNFIKKNASIIKTRKLIETQQIKKQNVKKAYKG